MADPTIVIDRIKLRRSFTPGYRPGKNGSRVLDEGEEFINFADGFRLIGDGRTHYVDLPAIPLVPAVADVAGLPEALSDKVSRTAFETALADKPSSADVARISNYIVGQTAEDRVATGADVLAAAAERSAAETAKNAAEDAAGLSDEARQAAQAAIDVVLPARNATTGARDAAVLAQAAAAAAALSAAQVAPNRTYAELIADTTPGVGTVRQVSTDPNSGTYELKLVDAVKTWVRTGTSVPALDALTAFVRQALLSSDDGAFNVSDLAGNIGMRFDGDKGLQAALAQFSRLITAVSSSSKFEVPGAFNLTANTVDGALLVGDLEGNIGLRLDDQALTTMNLVVKGLLSLSGGMSAASYNFGGCSLSAYPDPNVAFVISDTNGWISLALLADGTLLVPKIQTGAVGVGGDYSDDYIAERSNRAMALSVGHRGLLDTTSAPAIYGYNHAIWYGQSLCASQEAWPAKTLQGRPDVLMLGQSTRPGGANTATAPSPLSDSVLRPAVATVQVQGTGALLDATAQAALAPGDGALGEDPGVAGMQFARRLFLQRLGAAAAPDRLFVTSNVGVSGRSVEELSKGAATEYFNRLRVTAQAVKNAIPQGATYGFPALFWLQGEWNYSGAGGGTTDKALYKTRLKKLYDDFVADVCVGITGQSEIPAMITYQTGASYTVDATDLSIGQAQWELSQENPSWYLATPAYPATDKGGHLDANGAIWIGLQMCKVFHETVVMRRRWKPLHMSQATVRGKTVLVDFHLPSGTPLQFKPVYAGSVPTMYADKGFTLIDDVGTIPLTSVTLAGDAVVKCILSRSPVGAVNIYYGRMATFNGGGNLCDSDPTISPFARKYTAGSGDYAAANLTDPTMPFQVGKPDPLWNWAISQKITATAN